MTTEQTVEQVSQDLKSVLDQICSVDKQSVLIYPHKFTVRKQLVQRGIQLKRDLESRIQECSPEIVGFLNTL